MSLFGKDKDDNVVTLQEVLENDERSVEEAVDLKMKVKLLYEKMKSVLKDSLPPFSKNSQMTALK